MTLHQKTLEANRDRLPESGYLACPVRECDRRMWFTPETATSAWALTYNHVRDHKSDALTFLHRLSAVVVRDEDGNEVTL